MDVIQEFLHRFVTTAKQYGRMEQVGVYADDIDLVTSHKNILIGTFLELWKQTK